MVGLKVDTILKKYLQYLKLIALPFLAWIEVEDYATFIGLLVYILAIIMFLQGAFRIYQFHKIMVVIGVLFAVSLTFCFWYEVFKSEVIATVYKGGDMQDFHGELVLRKNGNCEIYNQSFMSTGRCNGHYKIIMGIVVIEGCNELLNEFDSIQIAETSYSVMNK